MNAAPPEPLYNQQSNTIYPSYQICAKNLSLDKGPNREFTSAVIVTRSNSRLGRFPGKKKRCQQKNVSQTSSITETSAAARQKIEVEQKCVERKKRHKNASVRCENASIPDKNDNKDERANIVAEERDKRRVVDLEHHIQQFKSKAYYKA